jgi:hypothetical protein
MARLARRGQYPASTAHTMLLQSSLWSSLSRIESRHAESNLPRSRRRSATVLFAPAFLAFAAVWAPGVPGTAAAAPAIPAAPSAPVVANGEGAGSAADLLEAHSRRVDDIRRNAEAVLGPLPAMASTPFFALAALSAAGLAAKSDLLRGSANPWVRAFCSNALIRESQRYSTWPVFLTLLGLALVGYVANSGKVRGIGGKLLRVIEDSSSVLIYSALSLGALEIVATPARTSAAVHMGILDSGAHAAIAVGLAMGLAAMMVARYAFDVLIWLVPIPFIDFMFETTKKLLTLGFLFLYLVAPAAAAVIALILVAIALLIAPWALRILGFSFRVLADPLLARLLPASRPRILDPYLVARHAPEHAVRLAAVAALEPAGVQEGREPTEIGGVLVAAKAVALALDGLPRRSRGVLLATSQGVFFARTSVFGRRRTWPLAGPAAPGVTPPSLVRALLWIELRTATAGSGGSGPDTRIALPRSLDFARLGLLLGAAANQTAGPAAAVAAPPHARPEPAGLASPP